MDTQTREEEEVFIDYEEREREREGVREVCGGGPGIYSSFCFFV